MENKKNCFNCCHFVQYYAKTRINLIKVDYGGCKKFRSPYYCRWHNFFKNSPCPKWELLEIQTAELRRECMENQLLGIIRKLTEIALILKSDEEENLVHKMNENI